MWLHTWPPSHSTSADTPRGVLRGLGFVTHINTIIHMRAQTTERSHSMKRRENTSHMLLPQWPTIFIHLTPGRQMTGLPLRTSIYVLLIWEALLLYLNTFWKPPGSSSSTPWFWDLNDPLPGEPKLELHASHVSSGSWGSAMCGLVITGACRQDRQSAIATTNHSF